jgi:hypothetical protein
LRSARFAKEGAIAATDELHAVAGQPDRRFPQGVAGEGGCFDLVVGEQRLGDRAVGCAFPAPSTVRSICLRRIRRWGVSRESGGTRRRLSANKKRVSASIRSTASSSSKMMAASSVLGVSSA